MYYCDLVKQHPDSANEWIEEKARELNKHEMFEIPKDDTFKKSRESPKTLGVMGKIMKFLRLK